MGLVAGGILIQFIPYGHDHTNPPVVAEPQWDSQQTHDPGGARLLRLS